MTTRSSFVLALSVLALTGCGATLQTGHETTPTGPTLDDVAWILGSWETNRDDHGCVYTEEWHRESAMLFVGHSHETCEPLTERQPFDESLRIEADQEGLVYVAWPTGQDRTEFPIRSGGASGFVAENPDHDFPTRIEYRRHEDGSGMDAIVSGDHPSFTLSMHPATAGDASTPAPTSTAPASTAP